VYRYKETKRNHINPSPLPNIPTLKPIQPPLLRLHRASVEDYEEHSHSLPINSILDLSPLQKAGKKGGSWGEHTLNNSNRTQSLPRRFILILLHTHISIHKHKCPLLNPVTNILIRIKRRNSKPRSLVYTISTSNENGVLETRRGRRRPPIPEATE